jgi:hypothetical protein
MRRGSDNRNRRAALRDAVRRELEVADRLRRSGDYGGAFTHLERAHVLGQRLTWLHVRAHLGMLRVGWLRRDAREIRGQLARIPAAALFSRVWVPSGNTGGADVPAMRPMSIAPELRALLEPDSES